MSDTTSPNEIRKIVPSSLDAVLRAQAAQHADRVALRSGASSLTYAELDERSDRLAIGLQSLGVEAGDRVAVLAANRIELAVVLFACAKLGAPDVPLNAFLRGSFLRHQLHDAGAKVLIADEPGLRAYGMIDEDIGIQHLVALDDGPSPKDTATISLDDLSARPGALSGSHQSTADTLLSIQYTSGTTGAPKGCMLSHGYVVHTAELIAEAMQLDADDVFWTATPFYHSTGRIAVFLTAMMRGATTVLAPEFRAADTVASWRETGATVFMGVGAMALAMLAQPESELDGDNQVRLAEVGLLSAEQEQEFERRFGPPVWCDIYGQTECQPIALTPPSELDRPRGPRILGRPWPGMEVRIVDADDQDVPAGSVGELIVRPPSRHAIFQGYWGRPADTLAGWTGLWHRTGDLVTSDDAGVLSFVDRKKDALRRRGENIASTELENAILGHPSIVEAAVHAVPGATEDEIKACLVFAPGTALEPSELFAFFVAEMPYFAVPRYVEIFDKLPRNATARVLKHELRDRGVSDTTWDFVALDLRITRATRR